MSSPDPTPTLDPIKMRILQALNARPGLSPLQLAVRLNLDEDLVVEHCLALSINSKLRAHTTYSLTEKGAAMVQEP